MSKQSTIAVDGNKENESAGSGLFSILFLAIFIMFTLSFVVAKTMNANDELKKEQLQKEITANEYASLRLASGESCTGATYLKEIISQGPITNQAREGVIQELRKRGELKQIAIEKARITTRLPNPNEICEKI